PDGRNDQGRQSRGDRAGHRRTRLRQRGRDRRRPRRLRADRRQSVRLAHRRTGRTRRGVRRFRTAMKRSVVRASVTIAAVAAGACAGHSRYVAPAAPAPAGYKESANWKPAQPADTVLRGKWWELFGDADLNALEE